VQSESHDDSGGSTAGRGPIGPWLLLNEASAGATGAGQHSSHERCNWNDQGQGCSGHGECVSGVCACRGTICDSSSSSNRTAFEESLP